jgi:hypothetical protein
MKQQSYFSTSVSRKNRNSDSLFRGIWLRWELLTQAEKVVCLGILLIPLWWLWGWRHLFLALAIGILIYDWQNFKKISLQHPSLSAVSAFCFGLYSIFSIYFYSASQNLSVNPNAVFAPLNSWLCFAFILWYIQDRKISIRLKVVTWSFSIIITLMILTWGVIFFVFHQSYYVPFKSIYGLITNKAYEFEPGLGNSNYLMPYFPTDESLPGLVRYVYFFPGPEALALVMAFVCLLALDIKSFICKLLLFLGAFFLLLTSGTRAVWVALPIILLLRYLLVARKLFGTAFIFVIGAVICFFSLTFTPTSELIIDKFSQTTTATANARADSTKARNKIYDLTIEEIENASYANLFFGHVVTGKGILPGYKPAVIGSHSFILGTLLYRSGIIGTGIFLTYWISLFWRLYQTKKSRPSCIIVMFLFTFTFVTMELESPVMPIVLLCAIMRNN